MVSQNLPRFNENSHKPNQKKSLEKVIKSENDRYENNPLLNKFDIDKNNFRLQSDHQSPINPKISNYSNSSNSDKRIKYIETFDQELWLAERAQYSYTQNSETELWFRNYNRDPLENPIPNIIKNFLDFEK